MSVRQYVYDLSALETRAPQPGHLIRHTSAVREQVSWFEILDARPVESRKAPNRWRLTVRRLDGPPPGEHFIWPSYAHARHCTCAGCTARGA